MCEVRAVRSAVAFRLSREVSDERSGAPLLPRRRAIEHAAACKVAFKSCALIRSRSGTVLSYINVLYLVRLKSWQTSIKRTFPFLTSTC